MTTKICTCKKGEDGTCMFRTACGIDLLVSSFEDGVATVELEVGYSITSFMRMIAGCFDENSNLRDELINAFNCDTKTVLNGFRFELDPEVLLVTKGECGDEKIRVDCIKKSK